MGSVAEWSKALVLGTSLFGGVGSNPTAARNEHFETKLHYRVITRLNLYIMSDIYKPNVQNLSRYDLLVTLTTVHK